jgi:hypothetical protein
MHSQILLCGQAKNPTTAARARAKRRREYLPTTFPSIRCASKGIARELIKRKMSTPSGWFGTRPRARSGSRP